MSAHDNINFLECGPGSVTLKITNADGTGGDGDPGDSKDPNKPDLIANFIPSTLIAGDNKVKLQLANNSNIDVNEPLNLLYEYVGSDGVPKAMKDGEQTLKDGMQANFKGTGPENSVSCDPEKNPFQI